MSIRNRLLLLLLAIALTPLLATSMLQQISIRVARNRLAARTREALGENARSALLEQLRSHVEILQRERQLADALLAREAREVDLRLAALTPPDRSASDVNMTDVFRTMQRGRGGRGGPDSGNPPQPGLRGGGSRPSEPEIVWSDYHFGADPNIEIASDQQHAYFQPSDEPNAPNVEADYQAQTCLVMQNDSNDLIEQAEQELATMTPVYHEIYSYQPSGILWLHTCLDAGLSTTYPGGVAPRDPSRFDLRRTAWYRQAQRWAARPEFDAGFGGRGSPPEGGFPPAMPPRRDFRQGESGTASESRPDRPGERGGAQGPMGRNPGSRRGGPGFNSFGGRNRLTRMRVEQAQQGTLIYDSFTGQPVVVRAVPVHYADGSFAGATAVVRTIPEIFASMQLPERWGTDIDRMLVMVDPNAPAGRSTSILLHDSLAEQDPTRPRNRFAPETEGLDSNDTASLQAIVSDISEDKAGVRVMEYKGRMCLWAYQPLDIPRVAAFLIVPQERVVELARTMEQSLLKESLFWLQGATMVVLIVAVVAVVLAALKARDVTNPINALIQAGRALGGGDYNAQVEIQTGDEFEQLGRVFNETGPKLREREKMKRSLELAAAIQQSLLPSQAPSLKNFEISGRCLYCDETGGDYYDFIDMSEPSRDGSRSSEAGKASGRIGVVVGDVSGHGISAALLMAATRGMIRADAAYHADDLSGLFQSLNTRLVAETVDDRFVTLFCGVLDDGTRTLAWASAGHEPAIWCHADTDRLEELPNTGMPLGIVAETTFEQSGPITLKPGDILVVGTDGIHEARDSQGEFFGQDRFLETIAANASHSAQAICDAVITSISQFVQDAPRTDDITLIVVKAKP